MGYKIQISHSPPKNTENYVLGIFLSKPQVWYIITLCVYIITEGVSHLPQAASYFHTQKRRLFAAAAFFYVPSDIIYVQSDHTYIVKNFGSSESRFAADA